MNNRIWKFLTSLKVTVVLLLLSTLLVFLGTLAQVNEGLWEAQERWFKSFWVFRRAGDLWWVPPIFPGGYTIGFGLLINLVAAHINRFQMTWKKAGIHLTHAGIILLLVGQLATDMLSRESFVSFEEGQTRAYSEAHRSVELVVASEPGQDGRERFVSFTEAALRHKKLLQAPEVPFELRIAEWGENAEVHSHTTLKEIGTQMLTAVATMKSKYGSAEALPGEAERALESGGRTAVWLEALKSIGETDKDIVGAAKRIAADPAREGALRKALQARFSAQMLDAFVNRQPTMDKMQAAKYLAGELGADKTIALDAFPSATPQGAGQRTLLVPKPEARGMDDRNFPYAKVEAFEQGKSLGTWLVSPWLVAQEIQAGGKTFRVSLRSERYAQPFSLTLLKTTHEVYPGTQIPKNFQSRVLLENTQKGEKREVDISMNNPLRYGGLTFYQHQMGRTEPTGGKGNSQLQVVRNPGWITPYLGCIIVSLGMAWQFLYHLIGFIAKPRAPKNAIPSHA